MTFAQCFSMDDRRDAWYAYVELAHRYADAVDRSSGSEVAELFNADGRWDGTDFGLAVITGREALIHHFAAGSGHPPSVHLVHNPLIVDVSTPRVTARSYTHSLMQRQDRTRHLIVGYTDVLMVDGDGWRFAERVLHRVLSY